MLAVDFPERNFVFKKPEAWTDEQCSDLSVWRGNANIDAMGNTAPVIISCWRPNKEDIEAISAGKSIYLYVTGMSQPPISLTTENPFIPNDN